MNKEPGNKDYVIIPNPIYDVVFRYLMEDYETARLILSTLTGENIIKLHFEPQTHALKIKDVSSEREIQLFHLDFTATVRHENGEEELIMIELQKAHIASDIFRFKRYIATNFQQKQKITLKDPDTGKEIEHDDPIRLYPIFILNFTIEKEIEDLVLQVNRDKRGLYKEKSLTQRNEFVDHLSYDMLVIQLPNIGKINPEEYENDGYKRQLYEFLQLFDQRQAIDNNRHRLRVFKALFPGYLERIIERLKAASSENPDLEEQMAAEDEYLHELEKRDNKISALRELVKKREEEAEAARKREREAKKREKEAKKKAEQERREKEEAKKKAEQERREKEEAKKKAEQERREKEEAKKREEKAKKREVEAMRKLAIKMKKYGESIEEIIKETGLSREEIEKL